MTIIDGDLIALAKKGRYDAIVHGCNCFVTMGAGIAKQIKKEFPEAYESDKETNSGDRGKLGTYTKAYIPQYGFSVINAYTQYDFMGKFNVSYKAIKDVFTKINKDWKGQKIGIPAIGAGLAGGDWVIISRIITKSTPDIDIEFVRFNK